MVKSHRSKRHYKKHRGGEGEAADNNSVLNMDEAPGASATPSDMQEPATTTTTTTTTSKPAEEEKKGWFTNLFGGSKTKRVRFRTMRKSKRSSAKRSATKSKRSGSKRSTRKRRSTKRKGSSRK